MQTMFGHEQMMWSFGGWLMMILMLIFWVIVIIGLVYLVKWLIAQLRTDGQISRKDETPLDILKKRYAKGEINKEEFEEKKRDLMG